MDPDNNGGQTPPMGGGDNANQTSGDDQGMGGAKCHCGRGEQNGNCVGCTQPTADCKCDPVQEEPEGETSAGGEESTPPAV